MNLNHLVKNLVFLGLVAIIYPTWGQEEAFHKQISSQNDLKLIEAVLIPHPTTSPLQGVFVPFSVLHANARDVKGNFLRGTVKPAEDYAKGWDYGHKLHMIVWGIVAGVGSFYTKSFFFKTARPEPKTVSEYRHRNDFLGIKEYAPLLVPAIFLGASWWKYHQTRKNAKRLREFHDNIDGENEIRVGGGRYAVPMKPTTPLYSVRSLDADKRRIPIDRAIMDTKLKKYFPGIEKYFPARVADFTGGGANPIEITISNNQTIQLPEAPRGTTKKALDRIQISPETGINGQYVPYTIRPDNVAALLGINQPEVGHN